MREEMAIIRREKPPIEKIEQLRPKKNPRADEGLELASQVPIPAEPDDNQLFASLESFLVANPDKVAETAARMAAAATRLQGLAPPRA